ncbi:hypothetical protein ACJMK2_018795 [Sinanodonta woodiana]|uniref:Mab-21-like HhH/H2TH-like domain-containing protein n=1 Tax=Sinanodonta woodiana TaxID=1069815 RepID=A0ABD3UEG9_SINWO
MYHQFPDFCYAVSHQLSTILDGVGYSPDDRDMNVRCATEFEIFSNIYNSIDTSRDRVFRLYMFGSRGEGSTGPGLNSDLDFLSQDEEYKIVTDLSDCQVGKIYLYMLQDGDIHQGYVKLQPIRILPDKSHVPLFSLDSTTDSFGVVLLRNTSFFCDNIGYRIGPAVCWYAELTHGDIVNALRCSQWPGVGNEWLHRRRVHNWPNTHQIQNILKYGCFATPVGHPCSAEKHMEWRLSFSLGERILVRSFGDTDMKVYILLKMVRKTFIQPVLKNAFSSYYCKVCMLWMRERTPSELWCIENILFCLILCIRQLHEWASAGCCPDYLITRNNIYDRKIVGTVRMKLIQILRSLLSDDFRFVLRIKCCHLGRILVDGLNNVEQYRLELEKTRISEKIIYHSYCVLSAVECRNYILWAISQNCQSLTYYLTSFAHASQYVPYSMQYPLKHIARILFTQLGFYCASFLKENAFCLSRANVEYLVALTSECLSLGMKSDAASVRLKMCGLGIVLENQDLAETCLQYISENHMRYMFSFSPLDKYCTIILNSNINAFKDIFLNVNFTVQEMLEKQVSFSVVYLKSEISITPIPLRMEMYRSVGSPRGLRDEKEHFWYDWAVVDSFTCLYFFQYMNFSRQGKDRHKQVAMDNMIHVIRTEPDIRHRDTALNLLAYCYMQENQPRNAFTCLRESLKFCPHHNSAKFYLGLLYNKVVAACMRSSML